MGAGEISRDQDVALRVEQRDHGVPDGCELGAADREPLGRSQVEEHDVGSVGVEAAREHARIGDPELVLALALGALPRPAVVKGSVAHGRTGIGARHSSALAAR